MRTVRVIYKNLRQRALATALTSFSIALGVGLVIAITCLRQQAEDTFNNVAASYELVVGAKGSPLQLVLNTVYHLDVPTGNIPYGYYQQLKQDWRVHYAIPFALGDNYHGFRLVGTEPEFFTRLELRGGGKAQLAGGRLFSQDYEAVIGAAVTDLALNQQFLAKHGVQDTQASEAHEQHKFTVVGRLQPTGTPVDRVIFISLGSVDEIHQPDPNQPVGGADLMDALAKVPEQTAGTAPAPLLPPSSEPQHQTQHQQEHKPESPQPPHGESEDHNHHEIAEVTAVILKLKTPPFMFQMHREINKGPVAQAAFPALEARNLFTRIVAPINLVLLTVSALVGIVAGISILVSIYNTLNERRREIAVMRALGARRRTIFSWLLWEAAAISAVGGIAGIGLGHLTLLGLQKMAYGISGITLAPWQLIRTDIPLTQLAFLNKVPGEILIVAVAVLLGALMGLLPAVMAYRTNVSANLTT